MKTFFFVLGQLILFVLFTAIFFLGDFVPIFRPRLGHIHWFASNPTPTTVHYFVPIGFLLMTGFFVFVFLIEALAGRVRRAGLWTTVAYLLALLVGFVNHFGSVTHDLS